MPRRTLAYVRLDQLVPALANPKAHDQPGLAASFDRFGYIEPIVEDDRTGRLLSGHGRLDQLQALYEAAHAAPDGIDVDEDGMWLAPVVRGWSSADDDEAQAAVIAVNRLVEKGGWEVETLAEQLEHLLTTPAGLDGTGYTEPDLAALLAALETIPVSAHERQRPDPDEIPDEPKDPVTRRGDVWLLGPHRLMCGDCRGATDVARLLDGKPVNLAFTSPPYADRRDYDETSGFVPIHPDAYVEWFAPVAAHVADHLTPDGSWFVNIKAGSTGGLDLEMYVLDLVLAHARQWGWHYAAEFCWERGGMPQRVLLRFKNQWEPVFQFARDRWKIRPENVKHESASAIRPTGPGVGSTSWADPNSNFTTQGEVGGEWFKGRVEDGWAYPGNRLPTFSGSHEATGHTAAFPVGLPAWFMRAYTDPGDVAYDPFVGSGSTLIAADQEGRLGRGMEISPGYCDVAAARWQRLTGRTPVLEATGTPHDFTQ